MAKLNDLNIKIGDFNSVDSCYIEMDISELPKNIKITKALLPLKALKKVSNDIGISVNYSYFIGNSQYNGWNNIEYISGLSQTEETKIYINFTDELQDAIKHGADKICFDFVVNPSDITYPFVTFTKEDKTEVDFISLFSFQKNGASHQIDMKRGGSAEVDLATGFLSISNPIIKSNNKALPLSISLNYNSNSIVSKNNWKFNFQQYLIEESNEDGLIFRYIDGNGKEQIIEETYYYDKDGKEIQISRHNQEEGKGELFVDLDGSLKYRDESDYVYEVKTKLEAPSGIKLVSSVQDLPGQHLVDYEPEELINIREQKKQIEESISEIDTSVALNKKQLCIYALTKEALRKQLTAQTQNIDDTAKLLELEKKLEKIKQEALRRNRSYRLTTTDSNDGLNGSGDANKGEINYDNADAKNELGQNYIDYGTIEQMYALTDYDSKNIVKGTIIANESSMICSLGIGDISGSIEIQENSNDISKEIYTTVLEPADLSSCLSKLIGDYNIDIDINEIYEEFVNSNIMGDNLPYKFSLGYNELFSIDLQVENILKSYEKYMEKRKEYEEDLKKLNFQEEQYEIQLPVHYLYNDSKILGFARYSLSEDNKIYRLVLITDYYENTNNINYKDFDSEEVENIVDSDDKVIKFDYSEKLSQSNGTFSIDIIDTREKKTKLTFENYNLVRIDFNDGNYALYSYDDSNNVISAVDNSGIGTLFDYSLQQVEKIRRFSVLNNISAGEVSLKGNLDYQTFLQNVIDNQTLSIIYNDYKSTTLIDAKNKIVNYIFDEQGKVRFYYENMFNENQPNVKNCEFAYNEEKLSFKTRGLQRSQNYLQNVDFGNSTFQAVSSVYFGSDAYCSDAYPSLGLVTANYHELTAKPTATNSDSMEIDATNLAKIKENQQINSLVLSGWAKADSAFVINEDEDYEDIVFPAYLQNRKFELRAEVTYNVNDQPKTVSYRKSFDWMNTDWQYCSVYLPLAYNDNGFIYTKSDITSIKFYFDYSYNTGNALYTELELKEAEWEANRYDKENKIAIQTSSHSPWTKTIYLNKDEMVERVVMSKKVIENGIQVEKQYENLYFYDKNNRLIKTIDYNGVVTENVFNDKGVQIKTLTYHKDEPTNVLYSAEKLLDDKGEEIGQTNEFGEKISSYEMIDGTGIVKTSTDNDGIKTSYGYNDNDDVIEMSTTIDDTANVNTYGYTLDFVTSLKHNDFEIAYNYDGQGRNNEILIAGQSYLTKSFADNEETTTLASNEVIKNVYDDDDNIIETHYQNEKIVQNDYDGYGNLSKTIELLTDETGAKQQIIHNYSYDKFGNVIKEETTQHAKNFNIINEYDINNNIDSTTFQIDDKNIFYNYTYSEDPEPKLVNILLPNNSNQSLHYDKLNRLDKIALLKEEDLLELKEFEYLKIGDHASNLVSKLKFSDGETYNDILKYKYDEKGNITEIRQNNKLIARYKYDSLSRLVREDNLPFNKTFTYEYDAGGNILCRTEYSFTLAENLENLLCQIFDYSYSVSGWRDQLKSYNGESFKYDVLGNPETYRGKTLTWSHGRQLDKFGDIASYTYNASGIRTSKIINTEKIYWKKDPNVVDNSKKDFTLSLYLNNNKVLRQYDSFNDLIFYYGEDGVVGFNITILNDATHSGDYYYKKNTQNDIIGIYSTSGEQIVEYVYDAWGNQKIKYLNNEGEMVALREDYEYNNIDEISAFIAVKNPFRYRSYYYDFETNLYYLNSRYYDPELGRFINADDISVLSESKDIFNGLNLYAYCSNNPIMNIDEDGDKWWDWLWKILVAVVIVVVTAAAIAVTAGAAGAAIGTAFAASLGLASSTSMAISTGLAAMVGGFTFVSGVVAGGIEIANQISLNGIDNFNFGSVALITATASLNTAGDMLRIVGKLTGNFWLFALGTGVKLSTVGLTYVYNRTNGNSDESSLISAIVSGSITLITGLSWLAPGSGVLIMSTLIQGGTALFRLISNLIKR